MLRDYHVQRTLLKFVVIYVLLTEFKKSATVTKPLMVVGKSGFLSDR